MDKEILQSELQFKAVRSSGAGGQNVNKVSSKVELTFDLLLSSGLSDFEKERLQKTLNSRLTNDGLLLLQCDESRSQHKNKGLVIKRFFDIIEKGLIIPKKRRPTNVPKKAKMKRLKSKRNTSEKKANRKPPEIN